MRPGFHTAGAYTTATAVIYLALTRSGFTPREAAAAAAAWPYWAARLVILASRLPAHHRYHRHGRYTR